MWKRLIFRVGDSVVVEEEEGGEVVERVRVQDPLAQIMLGAGEAVKVQ